MKDIDILIYNLENKESFNIETILSFYIDAGWWGDCSDHDKEAIYNMIKGSFIFAGIFLSGELIGMARVLSDGVSDAYIQDVFVLEKYRGKGIGKKVIEYLLDELKRNGIDWIGLIGRPGTGYFYNKCGFSEMKDFIPMK
ncbi:MAG: N-acetyltransferase, partial [Candidatus Muiribacterium halophilum]